MEPISSIKNSLLGPPFIHSRFPQKTDTNMLLFIKARTKCNKGVIQNVATPHSDTMGLEIVLIKKFGSVLPDHIFSAQLQITTQS